MNTRDYKLFRAGEYYHVYNRGDNRERIFLDEQDFFNFLKRLKISLGLVTDPKLRIRSVPLGSFEVLAYCLMDNHYHMLIQQKAETAISTLINKVSTSYAKYFNAKYKRVGNIFQDTFRAKHIDNDSYLTYLSAYIHANPTNPFAYAYSSLPEYLGVRNGNLCNPNVVLDYFEQDREKYKVFVQGYSFREHQQIKHLAFDED
jgi:putative transposase